MTDMISHLTRQAAFSRATFGPGGRTGGVIAHISEEFDEIARCYDYHDLEEAKQDGFDMTAVQSGHHEAAAAEWTDVAILAMDGLLRALSAAHPQAKFDEIARKAVDMIVGKQGKNELRDWPNWRDQDQSTAIGHVPGTHD